MALNQLDSIEFIYVRNSIILNAPKGPKVILSPFFGKIRSICTEMT